MEIMQDRVAHGRASILHRAQEPRENHTDVYPLSYGQQGLWFLYQVAPENPAYNSYIAATIREVVDVAALQRAFQRIVERYAALRTTFSMQNGEPVQQIQEQSAVCLRQINATAWTEEEVHKQLVACAQSPFNLEQDPLFQVTLFVRANDEYIILLKMHHIIVDYSSYGILLKELGILYQSEKQRLSVDLPPVEAQHTDFACWQHAWVESEEGKAHLAYWKEQLGTSLPVLNLPTSAPHAREQAYTQVARGALHTFKIDASLTSKLRHLAQAEGTSLFMVLLAAFQVLLSRYSGQDDIAVGTFVHGRNCPEFKKSFGYFINTLLLRSKVAQELSFRSYLAQVQQLVHAARKHGNVPLALLLEHPQAGNNNHTSPIQVIFNMVKAAQPEYQGLMLFTRGQAGGRLDLNGLVLESYPVGLPWAQFDLLCTVEENRDLLYASLEYNCEILTSETIARMAQHLLMLLESITVSPEQPIYQLILLSEQERHELLIEWNDTAAYYPRQQCLHHTFEQQARQTPEQVALIEGEKMLTYAELDAHANQLARHLCALGVKADVPVGVCIDRSHALVIALLAVLKAGGAYLPLDTTTPALRMSQILTDAGATLCLYQGQNAPELGGAITTVRIDEEATLAQYPTEAPAVTLFPENLVSIYYTSGSTGKPKGVASTHQGWVSRMTWMQQQYQLTPQETVLHKTTLTFDDAAVEIFWPLMVGARVALLEPGNHKDPLAILQAAISYKVAVLQFVPSMLAFFVEAVTPQKRTELSRLRVVISSGEPLRAELVRRFCERVGCGLYNQYGATEVSIDSTMYHCALSETDGSISVGRPIANHRVYVLDTYLQPIPVGVPGEVYLAGDGLARGYLHDPERTALAFLPNPFEPGMRMYKTGDYAHYRADGTLLYLGRDDDQIKIRGQRVELAEIEAVLATHPRLNQCALVARKYTDGYRLLAYYIPKPDEDEKPLEGQELRSFLSARLPDYMFPARFIRLEQFPMTESGKLHRLLLPDPGEERPELEQRYVAPATTTEKAITAIWQEILKVHIGIHDTFFDLGGHSLDATRAISRINQHFKSQVPLKFLYETPTIAQLAKRIDQQRSSQQNTSVAHPFQRQEQQGTFALSHAQQRQWLAYQMGREHAYGALFALEIEGPLNPKRFARALLGVVERHGILRTTFSEYNSIPQQTVHDTASLAYAYRDLSALASDEQLCVVRQVSNDEKHRLFVLETGPLLRATLFQFGKHRYRLLLSLHPIVFDGWCVNILLNDLRHLYQACDEQETLRAHLPQPFQYVDYVIWQNQCLAEHEMESARVYWLGQLGGTTPVPRLPADSTTSLRQPAAMTYRVLPLDAALVARLQTIAREQRTTLYAVLLAGLKMWLARACEQTVITVGTPMSGRSRPELEEIFGVLMNPIVLRTDLEGNPSCLEVLKRVSQTAVDALTYQDYPYDLIVQDVRRQTGNDGRLYSVVFVLQNASTYTLSFDGITMCVSLADRLANEEEVAAQEPGEDPTTVPDLHIEARKLNGQLTLLTQYNPLRFQQETVDHFHRQLLSVLEQFADNPQLRLSQLMLPESFDLDDWFAQEGEE